MHSHLDDVLFKEFLQETQLLPEDDLLFAEQKAAGDKCSLPDTLLELGILSPEEVTRVTAHINGVEFVDLTSKHIPHEVLSHIPEPVSRTNNIVCFSTGDDRLDIACIDLEATAIARELHPDKSVVPFLTNKQSLQHALKHYQKNLFETFGSQLTAALGRMRNPELFRGLEEWLPVEYHTEIAGDISTEKVLRNIIKQAHTAGASHIYLTPTEDDTVVSYRVHRRVFEAMRIGKDALPSLVVKLRHMIDQAITGVEIESGFTVFEHEEYKLPLQVLFFKTPHGIKPVIRIMKAKTLFDPIESLFASSLQQEFVYKNLDTSPLTLISGGPKSGVTRAYYGILEHINESQQEVMSIEDPLEVALSTISQVSVRNKKDHSKVLDQVLAARPDVIGFSPFVFKSYTKALATLQSGISLVAEIGPLKMFFQTLETNKLMTSQLLASIQLAVVSTTFTSILREERKDYKLNREELVTMRKFMPDGELLAFLKAELAIDQAVSKVSDITFSVKKARGRFSKQTGERKIVYARGAFSVAEIAKTFGEKEISMPTFNRRLRVAEKKALLQNALLLSLRGEVSIKDVLKYLNN